MSRSVRKHPRCCFVGSNFSDNKEDRTIANRKMRRYNRQVINSLSNGRTYLEYDLEPLYAEDWYDEHEAWEFPSVCMLDEEDYFKKLREVSDTWCWNTDGLQHTISVNTPVWDHSVPYDSYSDLSWEKHPRITLANAKRKHNWKTLKYYYAK